MSMEEERDTLYSKENICKIIIIFIGITFISIILITRIIQHRFNIFSYDIVHAHFEELISGQKQHIDSSQNEKVRNIRYLSRHFDLELFENNPFLQERLHNLQEDYRKGEFQTQPPNKIKVMPQQYLSLFNKDNQTGNLNGYDTEPLVSLSDPIISVEKLTGSNQNIIFESAFLENKEWTMIFQEDQEDLDKAFAGLNFSRKLVNLIFLLSCLGLILSCVLLFLRSRKHKSKVDSGKELVMTEQFIETAKLDSIGELASGIAHEINNPVAIMVEEAGWVQDLIHEGIDKKDNLEEFTRAMKQIETQGHRCKEITRKLLSFGRKIDSRIENIQLNDLIEEVISLSSEKARYANVKICTKLDPHLPQISASVTEMQQVITNIINNGLDAMENKGDRLDVISKLQKDQIIITIRDNGPGIHSINLNRVFDPFFSTKPVGKGSGLGLSICYSIIKKMGGRIDFESVLGEGSAFHIVLPKGLFNQ
jgi:signal transduction histidine kinase